MPRWLGDFVMATPTLRAIRRHFGSASIVGIMCPYLKDVLAGTDWVDEQWFFDARGESPETGHMAIVRRIRAAEFDMMILMPNSLRPAVLAWLGNAKERIGYARNGRGPLLTGKLYRSKVNGLWHRLPMVDYYLRLAEVVGCPVESRQLELAVSDADQQAAARVWANLGLREDSRVIALNSSGAYGAAKLWPSEHFAQLARRVADRLDHDVLVICGPSERQIAQDIVRLADHDRVFSLNPEHIGLTTTKGCLARCRLAISTDSGPRHVAAAMGKPVFTLLGPTSPIWIDNPTVEGAYLQANVDCLGCAERTCPRGHHKCMRKLTVDMVFTEVSAWMERNERIQKEIVERGMSRGLPEPVRILPSAGVGCGGAQEAGQLD
jgi:heptosyltransferase-2